MADTSSWSHSAATLNGHYVSSAPQHSSPYYQPAVFSSSLPSYTLTHTFTFPSYLNTPPQLNGPSLSHIHSQPHSSQRQQPLSPALSFRAYEPTISSASIFHSPVLSSPHTSIAAAAAASSVLPALLSSAASLSSSSSSSCPAPPPLFSPPSSSDCSSASPPAARSRLSASDRKARRAAKHRAIDLTRRTRESAALSHLKQLVSPHSATPSSSSATNSGSDGSVVSDAAPPSASSTAG